jgi:rare lipoprotein A
MRNIAHVLLLVMLASCSRPMYRNRHHARGEASYYADKYNGRKTAAGEVFSNSGYTAASNQFRLGAYVRVTNRRNGKTVYVRINDRMGKTKRVIDLTTAAADKLAFRREGVAPVKVKVVNNAKGKRKIKKQH